MVPEPAAPSGSIRPDLPIGRQRAGNMGAVTARHDVFTLLADALRDIRAYSGPGSDDREVVNALANLIHNWPDQIETATSEDDWARIIADAWRLCDERARPWLEREMERLGLDPATFPERRSNA
jgi:hypothetical protein